MPASEKERLALLNRLIEVLGREEAEVLMDSLPPVTWHQLATKDHIFALKDDIEANRTAIKANRDAIEANRTAIEANRDAIGANRTAIEANRTAIEANRDAIGANRAAIEANRDAIEASEQRLRSEMHAEFKMLRAENKAFEASIALQLAKQTRTMVFTMLGLAMPTWGAILAVGIS